MVFTLLSGLHSFPDLELSAILFNRGLLADKLTELGIAVTVIDESEHNPASLLWKTRWIIRDKRIHLLHTHRYKENFLGAIAARTVGVPRIVRTVHGGAEPFRGWKHLKAGFHQWLNLQVSRALVDRTIAVSDDLRKELVGKLGANRVVTIHNGIDFDTAGSPASIAEVKASLGIAPGEAVVGSVGRLTLVKNYTGLLQAFAQVTAAIPNAKLVLVGDGPERNNLQFLAESLGIAPRVVFCGFQPEPSRFLRIFDVFVLSSLREGISISLLEAMSSSVPVVVTNVGGNPEVVRDGESGILTPAEDDRKLADAIIRMLNDRKLAESFADNGRKRVTGEFSQMAMCSSTYRLYRSLFDETSRDSEGKHR
jgi:glycosyltransferase involved in cell wall biosynthesis